MRTSLPPLLISALCGVLSGCASPVLVEFNDREIEFEELSSATFPEDAGVTHMDEQTIHVEGDEPIRINGISVYADEDAITIGKRELRVAKNDRVLVDSDGDVRVVSKARKSSKLSFSSIMDRRAQQRRSKRRREEAAETLPSGDGGSRDEGGLLSFLR